MMEIRTALKCFNQRKCRFLTPCFYVCKRPVSISVKRGFYARKIPADGGPGRIQVSMELIERRIRELQRAEHGTKGVFLNARH